MDLSTKVNIVLCILSFVLAAVSVIAVVITLRQNSKMIEESTRPYISVCFHPLFDINYLILKNFGNSTAKIVSFHTNVDFHVCIDDESHLPFTHISGTYLHPGERILSPIDHVYKLFGKYDSMEFDIIYKSSRKTYSEHIEINLRSYADHASIRETVTHENSENIIAETLQDIAEILL